MSIAHIFLCIYTYTGCSEHAAQSHINLMTEDSNRTLTYLDNLSSKFIAGINFKRSTSKQILLS